MAVQQWADAPIYRARTWESASPMAGIAILAGRHAAMVRRAGWRHTLRGHDVDCNRYRWQRAPVTSRCQQRHAQRLGEMGDTVSVQRPSICVVGIMLASVMASAQAPNGGGPGPVLGIAEIPEMFFIDPDKGGYSPRASLTLYTRPDSESRAVALIDWPQSIDEAEYAYEEAGALVYGRERGYYLIRTSRGVGWLSPDQAGSFHPLETLITRKLTYLTDAWDGFLSASPGSANRTRVMSRLPGGNEATDVRVTGLRTVNRKLWLKIEVISHSICESDEPPTIKGRGWIRAHDATGAPTVWFHSRGC
jgi:hypothetical protein